MSETSGTWGSVSHSDDNADVSTVLRLGEQAPGTSVACHIAEDDCELGCACFGAKSDRVSSTASICSFDAGTVSCPAK